MTRTTWGGTGSLEAGFGFWEGERSGENTDVKRDRVILRNFGFLKFLWVVERHRRF